MTAQLRFAKEGLQQAAHVDLMSGSCTDTVRDVRSMVERVAEVVSGISVIGEACRALNAAGWTATISANRITVGKDVLAQLIPAKAGAFGLVSGRWVIYSTVGARPVWIVGAEQSDS